MSGPSAWAVPADGGGTLADEAHYFRDEDNGPALCGRWPAPIYSLVLESPALLLHQFKKCPTCLKLLRKAQP